MSTEAAELIEAVPRDDAVANTGILLILAAGAVSGQFQRLGSVAWGGAKDPSVRNDMLVLLGEVVFIVMLSVISGMNRSARNMALALEWALLVALIILKSQVIVQGVQNFQSFTSGQSKSSSTTTTTSTKQSSNTPLPLSGNVR